MITSLSFAVLLALLVFFWYRLPPHRHWMAVLVVSLLLYTQFDWRGLPWLVGSSVVVWLAALRLAPLRSGAQRNVWITMGISAALVPLAALKYLAGPLHFSLLVPLGISYYSLQLIGYLLDTAAGRCMPERNFGRVLCYGTFFLSISQGPFNRYARLMPQLDAPAVWDRQRFVFGLQRMAWGYFLKFAVAERFAPVADAVFSNRAAMDRSQLVFGVAAFSIQLYADFSGYTEIALGAGELLGLQLPANFRQPYFAQSASDFWRRWHISLSEWFRDYVYIPLGGNRRGLLRLIANLLAVWLLTGIWHGSGDNYLVWGLYWFLVLAFSRVVFRKKMHTAHHAVGFTLRAVRTSLIAGFGWMLFRAGSLAGVLEYLNALANNSGCQVFTCYWEVGLTSRLEIMFLFLDVALLLAVDALHEHGISLRHRIAQKRMPVRWILYQAAFWGFLLMGNFLSGGGGTFLYERF
jgi:D-alanyl-lipoteichoic acid acyltransferase DltB (MBOAT superfamily)